MNCTCCGDHAYWLIPDRSLDGTTCKCIPELCASCGKCIAHCKEYQCPLCGQTKCLCGEIEILEERLG